MAKIDTVEIDVARINETCRLYFLWKDLNTGLRSVVTRGINFPEAISEPIVCYSLDLLWNKGSFGDARTRDGKVVEIKACSNFDRDLTSFSPKMEFDVLIFLRLDQTNNLAYIYDVNLNATTLGDIQVNATQTLRDQQEQGRRPRFSIINKIIIPQALEPTAIFDIRTIKVK